jgi:hypothetical protein
MRGSDIEHGHVALTQPPPELGRFHRLESVAVVQIGARHLLDLEELPPAEFLELAQQPHDRGIGQPVVDELRRLAAVDEPGRVQGRQMGARVGDGEGGLAGEDLDRLLALGQQVEQLQPLGAGDRLS